MKRRAAGRFILFGSMTLIVLSVVLAVSSFFPVSGAVSEIRVIVDDYFRLTPQETYRQGLGSFHGDENISLAVSVQERSAINFSLLTYGGSRFSNVTTSDINYSFPAGADYYEAVFFANTTGHSFVHFQVAVQRLSVGYPFSWLTAPAKVLFLASWGSVMLVLLLTVNAGNNASLPSLAKSAASLLGKKGRRRLKLLVLLSFVFWLLLLVVNTFPLATFENWYTDNARHPYSANLFTKVGFSVFDTPLGKLASQDGSVFKFVTWPEMPHLYPLGSIFMFLPFGLLLESGVLQALVFKLEIALFLVVSHVCLYFFLKRFWKLELSSLLKALAIYIFYVVLVVYSANGQFDAAAFLFAFGAAVMFLNKRYDLFLLLAAVSATFKYQAVIFLLPLILVGLLKLVQQPNPRSLFKNKAVLATVGLGALDLFTAFSSMPFLLSARPELVLNGVNAFSPHAQVPWLLQAFAVLLTLGVTLASAVYLFNKTRLLSVFALFTLLPTFTMPYFQPWYLPFFFVYMLLPMQKRALDVAMFWLVFMAAVLAFGGLAYNPVQIFDNVRRVLNLY
ncbi:MAG TPA: hypothetical protein VJ066_03005 [Candidatus Bathyarchaeia archaeon]|nr:hypothetical protein [Candidatus Bathyarchaeia archaeon]